MESKRKSAAPDQGNAKRQRLETPTLVDEGSSSGLSSVHSPPRSQSTGAYTVAQQAQDDSDSDAPLSEATAIPAQHGVPSAGKRPKAISSSKTPYIGAYPLPSGPSTPEPYANSSPEKMKTSQKGVGMSRTVFPSNIIPPEGSTTFNRLPAGSSPEISLAKVQQRHKEALQAEAVVLHADQRAQAEANGSRRVKAEDLEETLDVLTAGMPVDVNAPGSAMGSTIPEKERPAITEERQRIIVFQTVSNSELPLTPATLLILTGLKNIFQKQLPKMPREYIARLVYDREHWSMAIVKRGYQVVGGITYRPFEQRGFAEIVFCAITGTEQVRGYGSHLMNHLKDYVRAAHPGVNHFLTYADNYAVGYFKKQGFTKEITLDRALWAAYIKDYEGGTIMQCTMLPRVSYLDARKILMKQKEAILAKIRQVSRSHIVYRGRDVFRGDGPVKVDPSTVPGLKDVGWNPALDELTRRPQRGPQHMIMQRLLTDLQAHPSAWPFMKPVNKEEVTDYYDIVKNPMDLETMEARLDANHYPELSSFLQDAQHIFDSCRAFNSLTSNYVKNANRLEKYLKERTAVYVEEV